MTDRFRVQGATVPRAAEVEVPYRRLLEASTKVLIALVGLDGEIQYVTPACRWLLGYAPDELCGREAGELIPPGLAADAIGSFRAARRGRAHLRQMTLARRKDGTHVHLRFDATPMTDTGGEVEGVVIAAHEIGEDLSARGAAGEGPHNEPVRGELLERLPAVVYVAEPGPRGRWQYVSPQIERILGYTAAEWLDDPELWAGRLHPDDRERVLAEEERDTARGERVTSEYRMVTRRGEVVWVRDEAVMRIGVDGVRRYDGFLTDVTERKRFESQLQFLAERDPLTGLYNRRRFLDEVDAELKRWRRHSLPASVLMLDLDNLKHVNDSLGHAIGDALIRATAAVLAERLRESDTVARLGGDEFAALLRGADAAQATRVADEVVASVRKRAHALTRGLAAAGASAGVAELRAHFVGPDDAMAAADAAMYEAKRGRGREIDARPARVRGHAAAGQP